MDATGEQATFERSTLTDIRNSCFNAFSRVDMRVDVKIPGGVQAYIVDIRGERYVTHALDKGLELMDLQNLKT